MDEKAKIFRTWVWLSPIHPPRAAERMAMVISGVGLSDCEVMRNNVIGGNFMAVDRSRPVIREQPCRTSGNQKWNGASPSFIAIAAVRIRHEAGQVSWVMSHCPVCHALVMLENRIRAEAAAWTRKYLVAASMARGWWDLAISGRMARVLISSPVQAVTQWLLESVIVDPRRRLMVQISFACGFTSRGRS